MSRTWQADIAIIGCSLGGVLAAYRASQSGQRVLMVCEDAWIGGQMTAQAVPPDEHQLIEQGGGSASYLRFRKDIRGHYRQQAGFLDRGHLTEGTNPGNGWVSRLCFEPVVAARWFEQLLLPAQRSGRLQLLRLSKPVAAVRRGRQMESVTVQRDRQGACDTVFASVFIDATDAGDLLALAGLPYRVGKEARSEFGEPDAPAHANPQDQQPITHVMALRRHAHAGPVHVAPEGYARWRAQGVPGHTHALFSCSLPGHPAGTSLSLPMTAPEESKALDWWRYRRIVSAGQWQEGHADVTLVNWAQNDLATDPLIDGPRRRCEIEREARELSRCLLHWLQTEAPRPDGGHGFPEWQAAPDVLGTCDGMAERPYLRESRRIRACGTLTQLDLMAPPNQDATSVAIGWYPLDIHPTCRSGHGVNAAVQPFQIPLACLVPEDVDNLLPASKNLGVSHLANACTRVHPVEWAIGEVAGMLASFTLETGFQAHDLLERAALQAVLFARLDQRGIARRWPEALLSLRPATPRAA
jgi:hypothetical protein